MELARTLGSLLLQLFKFIVKLAIGILQLVQDQLSSPKEKKQGTYIDDQGYRRYCDSKKPVHRWAAEKKLGRKLLHGEVVHHKDRNKLNNHPDNLWVFRSQQEHDRVHRIDAERYGKEASYRGFRHG